MFVFNNTGIFKTIALAAIMILTIQGFSQTGIDTLNQKKTISLSEPSLIRATKISCQDMFAYLDTLNCIPIPDTLSSYLYFRLCLGDSVFFKAGGIYPQNGTGYTQHDTLCTYHWEFGDGVSMVTNTSFVWHKYDSAKGYEMSVYLTDTNNCISLPAVARITVSANPVLQVLIPAPICLGDTALITAASVTNFTPYSYSQVSSQKFDSTMFIPDGPNCNPANPCYNTDVFFTSFTPGQTINAASDILSLCVFMEHSYVGDLEFTLVCPTNKRVILKKFITWGGADMGIRGFPDSGCKPADNPIGTPWNYCWSQIYPNIGTINANAGLARLDSTDRTNNLKYYLPDSSFAKLIGCPLNGKWTIEICDRWAVDNGYIFEWTMNLDPSLLPQSWGYIANIDSIYITGPGVLGSTGGITYIQPSDTGNFNYLITFVDDFGCAWSETFKLRVNPVPPLNLGNDTTTCAPATFILNAGPGMTTYLWNTGATTQTISVTQSGIYQVSIKDIKNCRASDAVEINIIPLPVNQAIKHN